METFTCRTQRVWLVHLFVLAFVICHIYNVRCVNRMLVYILMECCIFSRRLHTANCDLSVDYIAWYYLHLIVGFVRFDTISSHTRESMYTVCIHQMVVWNCRLSLLAGHSFVGRFGSKTVCIITIISHYSLPCRWNLGVIW